MKSFSHTSQYARPYPRFPPPKIMALLLDPMLGRKNYVFLAANKKGLREIFGDITVAFTNDYEAGFRVYHQAEQDSPEYGYYARPNPAGPSFRGKVLLTGHSFKELNRHAGDFAMQSGELHFGKSKYD